MAVDSKINDVRVLVQGASATNISPNLNPAYPGSYGVTTSEVTGVSDHLELGGVGRLSVQGPVQSGNITHTPYMDRCLEMVIEAVWAPQAVLYVASPFRVVADPTTANSYVAQVLVGNGDTWHTISQFALPPAPTRAYVRFLLTYLGSVPPAMITVTVIPEGGAPTDSTFTLSSSYEVPKYPLHVGAAQGAAVTPAPTQAWATLVADPMGSDAVSVDSRNWIWKDVIGLAGSDFDVDHLISANGGSLTISGCGVSATVQASGKARLAILGELFGKYATELQNAGYVAAQHYDGERFYVSVNPKAVDPYVGDHHKFRLNGTVTYPGPIAFNFADYVSTVQTYPSYRPPPAVRQLTRLSVYIPNPSESYTLRAVIQSDSSIEVNLGGGGDVAQQLWGVARYQGFGPVSQPSPGLYVTEKLHAGYYTYSTLICTFRQILALPPAVSKIYGLRVTNSSRNTTEFPLLPWPTSSVESPTPAAGADVWLNLTFEDAGLIDHSNFAHAKLVEGDGAHSPNRALSGGTRPAEDYCVSTGLGVAELAYEVDARDLNGSPLTVETTLYISSDVVAGYMLALSGACYFHVSPLTAASASIEVLGWVGFGTRSPYFLVSCNAWHHVALVDDGTSVRTYLDGALYDEYLITGPKNFYFEPLGIARIYGRPDLNGPAYVRISEFVVTKAAKYAAPFTPHPLSSALYSSTPKYYLPFLSSQTTASSLPNSGSFTDYVIPITPGSVVQEGGQTHFHICDAFLPESPPSLTHFEGPLTIEFWLRVRVSDEDPYPDGNVLSLGYGPQFAVRDGGIHIYDTAYDTPLHDIDGGSYTLGVWEHWAFVKDASHSIDGQQFHRMFRDGQQVWSTPAFPTYYGIGNKGLIFGASCPYWSGPAANADLDDVVVTEVAKYRSAFTPPLRGSVPVISGSSGGTGGTGSTDIAGAQYIVLDDWTTQGVGNEQALPPAAYGLGAAVFDDWLVQHAVTVDGSGVSLSGAVVLDDWTLSGAGVAAMPTNLTGAVTLDDFVTAGSGVASIPIPGTGGVVLSSWVTAGNMLPLAPSEGVGAVTLGTWTSAGDGDLVPPETAQIAVTLPKLTMTGGGAPRSSAIVVSLPPLTAQARGGAGARGVLPRVSVAASAVVVNVARTHVELPALTVSADGRSAHQGTAVLTTLGAVCGAYGGGYARMALPALTAGAQGVAGAVARIAVSLPRLTAVARVSPVNVGRAHLTLPRLVAGSSARAIMTLPLLRMSADAAAVFAESYEAYVLNLGESMDVNPRNNYEARNPQMTHYTNYPFIQIVRYKGAHYGVAADGLYLIGGGTDDGAPIAWAVDTCTTDFGSSQKKTVASVYLGGTVDAGVDFTIRSGETADSLHPYTTTASTALRNHRQRFGLGRRTRYYSIGLAGSGNIELDSLDFEVVNTSRRI